MAKTSQGGGDNLLGILDPAGTSGSPAPVFNPPQTAAAPATQQPAQAPAQQVAAQAAAQMTAEQWASELLNRLGMPVTADNVRFLVAWEAAEGGHWNNSATYNPLNTTQNAPGATPIPNNAPGVKAYTSWDQGLTATVQTLQGDKRYRPILNALKAGNNPAAAAQAVVDSPWGTKSINLGQDHSNYGTSPAGYLQAGGAGQSGIITPSKGTPTYAQAQQTVNQYLSEPQIAQQFGYLAGFIDDPTIGPILKQATKEGWDTQTLFNAVSKTDWWRKTDASARTWQAIRQTDPASWNSAVATASQELMRQMEALGIRGMSSAQLGQIAATAINTGKTDDTGHIQDANWARGALAAQFHYNAQGAYTGEAGRDIASLKQQAGDYLVPLSDQTVGKWTQQILSGAGTTQDFTQYLEQQAKSLYPTISAAIDKGITPKQYLDPYAQMLQSTLGISPDSVNWMDPKWSKALNTTTTDGQRAPMSLSDWGTYLKSLPEYQTTPGANQAVGDLGTQILQAFGKVA